MSRHQHRTLGEIVDRRLEQADREDWSTLAGSDWNDAVSLHIHLSENTNLINAADRLRWDELLSADTVALDLGCGSGWLSALLSRQPKVEKVIAWDASPSLLSNVLPQMVTLLNGDMSKLERVCGRFTPLLLESGSVGLVVMSSAFHHASDLDELLAELVRVTKANGLIVLMNEVPFTVSAMLWQVASTAVAAAVNSMTIKATLGRPGYISADQCLYDPVLGDHAMTRAQWRRLFRRHHLAVEEIDTSLPSYPPTYRRTYLLEQNLTHFILRVHGPA